ncbi:NAD-dependent protein deacetylase sirtuin-2 [Coemansia nantahalensis]|uniref:NAD-dependent protein deacetylase sirtuin-2 n=2 Tax=Coemansia TaxID=4863 RepID=A0ACC1JVT4_9FUNG|nr:NAD-dependent protein deacetylase sirtuin-2 [Coemansia nantahalensis]
MGHESSVDDLARDLEEALRLDDKQADRAGDSAASGSDAESTHTAPSSPDSTPEPEGSPDTDSAAAGAPVTLTVHRPLLPAGVTSLLAGANSALDAIAERIQSGMAKRIIVMAGAGISTAAGIPDFRSPGSGLYANLQKYTLPYPEAIFTLDYFRKKPKPFYVLAKELYPGQFAPTASHFFVKLLAQRGLLLRHYTQNIDCLERAAGVESSLIVEAHGSFHQAHCIGSGCGKEFPQDWIRERIFSDQTPRCDRCSSLVKPDITFFGEGLPARFFDMIGGDFAACDMLTVMGTSLQVQPFASLVGDVGPSVPRLLINRERVGEGAGHPRGFDFDGRRGAGAVHRDALVLGDCDDACRLLADKLGWAEELAGLVAGAQAQTSL